MGITAIVGCKWGDEGKGKVAAYYAKDAKIVMRTTGGNNAGHTVIYNGTALPLHLVPGGITYPQTTCIIGPGTVIDPAVLLEEIRMLKKYNVPDFDERLKISGRAHVIFPYHKDLDELHEHLKKNPVGTTKRGIGPTYSDKDNRIGIRIYDLLLEESQLREKIEEATILHNQNFANNGMANCVVAPAVLAHQYHEYGEQLKQYVTDINPILAKALDNDDKIVVEGAQAFRLDLDHGDYPMCTSSNCTTSGALCGGALPPNASIEVIGIDKAYNSRVGNGPFPTKEVSSIDMYFSQPDNQKYPGDIIRELGHEYGTTTKRPRDCGWYDCCISNSAKHILGVNYLCINHLDTIGLIGKELGYIKICTSYSYQGKIIDYYPDDITLTGEIPTPIYEVLSGGWEIDSSCKSYDELPELAKKFIEIVEKHSHIPVKFLGTGPANDDLIVRDI